MKIPATPTLALVLLFAGLAPQRAVAGSLWNERSTNERGMFADQRAKRIGDIVTVIVQENTAADNSLDLKTAREAKGSKENMLTTLVNQFLTALPGSLLGKNRLTDALNKQNLPAPPQAPTFDSTALSTDYHGGGAISNKQTLTSRVSITVVDVLPNGNMVVEGVRVVRFSGETQYGSLRGVIRAADVSKDNTVLSSNIADAQIEFVSEGSLTEAQKQGWLLRLAGRVNPI